MNWDEYFQGQGESPPDLRPLAKIARRKSSEQQRTVGQVWAVEQYGEIIMATVRETEAGAKRAACAWIHRRATWKDAQTLGCATVCLNLVRILDPMAALLDEDEYGDDYDD
jgi:hypothetical protein